MLTVNVGSSSLKLAAFGDGEELLEDAELAQPGGADGDELVAFVARHVPVTAVGHRIVHGGSEFTGAVVVDEGVRRRLEALVDLAPLHLPACLEALDAFARLVSDAPQVACFDTAFHARMPEAASTYALPEPWRLRWKLRRYGFHGLSHAYVAARVAELSEGHGRPLRLVSCHLGSGASLAAIEGDRSLDTTMGFTPLEGLVMGTRSGSVDPGLVLWLEEHVGLPPAELASTLEYRSGLLGLAGSADLRLLLAGEAAGDERAAAAIEVYLHRLRSSIAAMTAATRGLDVLVFTGGVGEHSPEIRRRATEGLAYLGVEVDPDLNASAREDAELSDPGAGVRTFALRAREDLQMLREVRAVLSR